MQTPHPLGVATGQIIVDRDDMYAISRERIEVGRQRGDQCFAFASAHFGDLTVVQHHPADHLHVEMAHAQRPLAGFADNSEGFGQQGFERFPLGHARLELSRLAAQLIVRKRADARLQRIDLTHSRHIPLDQPIVAAAEYLFE